MEERFYIHGHASADLMGRGLATAGMRKMVDDEKFGRVMSVPPQATFRVDINGTASPPNGEHASVLIP